MNPRFITSNHRIVATWLAVLCVVTLGMSGCGIRDDIVPAKNKGSGHNNRIVAVSYALQFITQKIAGDKYRVDFPAKDAKDPKQWSPKVEQIADIQNADLIIVNGAGAEYAKWLVRATLPESKLCHSCRDFELRDFIIVNDYQIVHSHGPEGEHSHPYFVPYPWLDPDMAIKQAKTISNALASTYPPDAELFASNYLELKSELENLSEQIQPVEDFSAITASPFLKYLTRRFSIQDYHLLWFDLGQVDDMATESKLLEKLLEDNKDSPFLSPGKLPATLSTLVERDGRKLQLFDILDHEPATGDYLSSMQKNIEYLNGMMR